MIYTLTQQPINPGLTQPLAPVFSQGVTQPLSQGLTQQISQQLTTQLTQQPVSPGLSPGVSPSGLSPVVTPPGLSPGLNGANGQLVSATSPGVSPISPVAPMSLQPGIMHLINYGDKDLGLLLSQRMELVWHGEFDRLFSQYFPHMWYLVPTFNPPNDRWRTFKDSAKVRFSCQSCGHGWTSMKGRVIFWFQLNYVTNTGYVMFKLYGQQCQRCKNGTYEHAMWYPEEVVKVLGNVYNRVGQIYYGFIRPPLRIDRRAGKPRNQHNAELCQACKEGLCREEWSFS